MVTLCRAASFIRAGAPDQAELELLALLDGYAEEDLAAVYIGAVALVRELDFAPMLVGPVLPGREDRTLPSSRGTGTSGRRRDYAYAITTALRARLNPSESQVGRMAG